MNFVKSNAYKIWVAKSYTAKDNTLYTWSSMFELSLRESRKWGEAANIAFVWKPMKNPCLTALLLDFGRQKMKYKPRVMHNSKLKARFLEMILFFLKRDVDAVITETSAIEFGEYFFPCTVFFLCSLWSYCWWWLIRLLYPRRCIVLGEVIIENWHLWDGVSNVEKKKKLSRVTQLSYASVYLFGLLSKICFCILLNIFYIFMASIIFLPYISDLMGMTWELFELEMNN